jgi:hypothetical protein
MEWWRLKIAFITPSIVGVPKMYWEAMEKSIPLLHSKGYDECFVPEMGCPYISHARATGLRRAIDNGADTFVFIDYDLSWGEEDLLKLAETKGDVVAGLYRFKKDDVEYMGTINSDINGFPIVKNGLLTSDRVPAGFLKITLDGVKKFMKAYPELLYGDPHKYSIDLFNHGAIDGVWYGEDYAFSKRWIDRCGEIKVVPDLNLTHWKIDYFGKAEPIPYIGNYHKFLLSRPKE